MVTSSHQSPAVLPNAGAHSNFDPRAARMEPAHPSPARAGSVPGHTHPRTHPVLPAGRLSSGGCAGASSFLAEREQGVRAGRRAGDSPEHGGTAGGGFPAQPSSLRGFPLLLPPSVFPPPWPPRRPLAAVTRQDGDGGRHTPGQGTPAWCHQPGDTEGTLQGTAHRVRTFRLLELLQQAGQVSGFDPCARRESTSQACHHQPPNHMGRAHGHSFPPLHPPKPTGEHRLNPAGSALTDLADEGSHDVLAAIAGLCRADERLVPGEACSRWLGGQAALPARFLGWHRSLRGGLVARQLLRGLLRSPLGLLCRVRARGPRSRASSSQHLHRAWGDHLGGLCWLGGCGRGLL